MGAPTTNAPFPRHARRIAVPLAALVALAVAATAHAPVSVAEGEVAGTARLTASAVEVGEADGVATLTVTREGSTLGAVTVDVVTADGTATADADYTATASTLEWIDGEGGEKAVLVPVLDDVDAEADETIAVSLANPTGDLVLGSPDEAVVTIRSDDEPGTIALASNGFTVNEADGTVRIAVERSGGDDGAVGVSYATSDGTATAPADYAATSGTVTWADREAGPKTFTIPVADDHLEEGGEAFGLALANVTGGAALGAPDSALVFVLDDDEAGAVGFEANLVSVIEGDGNIPISVTRTGGRDGPVSVRYEVAGGTATAGVDFTGGTGDLTWADGDTSAKQFVVKIVDDSKIEPTETARFSLRVTAGAAEIAGPDVLTLQIVDDAGGTANDRFFVNRTGPDGVTIDGRGGSDSYRVDLGKIVGPVVVHDTGARGTDTVQVNAPGTSKLALKVASASMLEVRRGAERVRFDGIEAARLNGGSGVDTLTVDAGGRSARLEPTSVRITGFPAVTFTSIERVVVTNTPVGTLGFSLARYRLVASNGGVFAFGDARFFGSTGGVRLSRPIVGMASTPSGRGYWLVASDGGVFAFGDARFLGSAGTSGAASIVGIARTATGRGYWLAGLDGRVYRFGDALYAGSALPYGPAAGGAGIVGIASP